MWESSTFSTFRQSLFPWTDEREGLKIDFSDPFELDTSEQFFIDGIFRGSLVQGMAHIGQCFVTADYDLFCCDFDEDQIVQVFDNIL